MTPRHLGNLCYEGRSVDPTTWTAPTNVDLSKLVGKCCICGAVIHGREAVPEPDPAEWELGGDDTPVVECDGCRYESARDI